MLTDLQIERQLPDPTKRLRSARRKDQGLFIWSFNHQVPNHGPCATVWLGMPEKFTIGSYPAVGLAAARKKAQKALAEVVDGVSSIRAERKWSERREKAAKSTADRVENVVDAYVESYLGQEGRSHHGQRKPSVCSGSRVLGRSLARSGSASLPTMTSTNC